MTEVKPLVDHLREPRCAALCDLIRMADKSATIDALETMFDVIGAFKFQDSVKSELDMMVYNRIQAHPDNNRRAETNDFWNELGQTVREAEHQSYDGWDDDERYVIVRFVRDIKAATHKTMKEHENDK